MDQKYVLNGTSRVDMEASHYLKQLGIGEHDFFIIEPNSIGDVYQTLCLLGGFRKKYVRSESRIFFWSQPRTGQIFSMFDVMDVIINSPIDYGLANLFAQRYRLSPGLPISMATDMYADGWLYRLENFGVLSPLHTKRLILGLDLDSELNHAVVSDQARLLADERARASGVLPGKSLLIINHAASVKSLPIEAFGPVVENFPGPVFTDVTPPGSVLIPGTQPITLPLDQLIPTSEKFGHVLALRSGIIELLSNAKTKLFTIYPRIRDAQTFIVNPQRWAAGIHHLSLARTGLHGYATEQEIHLRDSDDTETVADRITTVVSACLCCGSASFQTQNASSMMV